MASYSRSYSFQFSAFQKLGMNRGQAMATIEVRLAERDPILCGQLGAESSLVYDSLMPLPQLSHYIDAPVPDLAYYFLCKQYVSSSLLKVNIDSNTHESLTQSILFGADVLISKFPGTWTCGFHLVAALEHLKFQFFHARNFLPHQESRQVQSVVDADYSLTYQESRQVQAAVGARNTLLYQERRQVQSAVDATNFWPSQESRYSLSMTYDDVEENSMVEPTTEEFFSLQMDGPEGESDDEDEYAHIEAMGASEAFIKELKKLKFEGKGEENKKVTCVICLEDIGAENKYTFIPGCSHRFHYDCIVNWLKKKNSCPICRYIVPDNLLQASKQPSNLSNNLFDLAFGPLMQSVNRLIQTFSVD